ncbi:MAG: flagellar protein FlgN [Nitrospiraceae bacterium]
MDVVPAPAQELVDVLHQEIAQLHKLAAVATEERTALRRLSMPAFDSVNEQRAQMLELIRVLEERREAILHGLADAWGVPRGTVTLSMVLARVGRDLGRTIEGQQQELERSVDAVRQLMAVNRLAMAKLVDFIQQTLAAAHPRTTSDGLYSGTGVKKSANQSGRVIVQQG